MEKPIIIIGAGIAGLAAGCYGRMNGYQTKIFEMHDLPGGLCTAWERKGYIFDGCIHYLYGSAPGEPFNRLWEELGAIQGRHIIHHHESMCVRDFDGHSFFSYCDPDRLEQHIKDLSPADAELAEDLAQGVRDFMSFDMSVLLHKPRHLMGPDDWAQMGLKMMPFVGSLAKWGLVSAEDFAGRFKDPFLRRAMALIFAWEDIPMMAGLAQLAYMHKQNAGFPEGGSLEFARAIEHRYLELGGELYYKAQVEKILVEDDRAIGVRLYNDEVHHADYVVSAADGHGTIFDMLGGKYINKEIKKLYDPQRMPYYPLVLVSLGVNRDLSQEPYWATYLLPEPVTIAGEDRNTLGVKNYCFDPRLAPAGKSVIEVILRSNYPYWQRIYGRKLYDTEQIQVSDQVIALLEKIYPGLSKDVEVVDVATPLSYERYTGNWLGSTCGWLLTKQTQKIMLDGLDKTLPGLKSFYLAGQWVEPGGGLPQVASSGRNAIQLICHQDQKPFLTSTP